MHRSLSLTSRKYMLDEISNSLLYTASTEYVYDVVGKIRSFFGMPHVETTRVIFAMKLHLNNYRSNFISTCKYNLLTFVPKFIFEQLMKFSNIIFLIISIFQLIPNVSPSGKYSTIMPLAFMLSLSALKEYVEDLRRRFSDQKTNNSVARVYRGNTWIEIMWHQLRVGDIIRVLADETFPADVVLLSTSDPCSICYIETCSLDGETNQKIRQCLGETSIFNSEETLKNASIRIDCEPPNNRIYEFNGSISIDYLGTFYTLPLNAEQIVLRGSQLRNTLFVLAAVVYTGQETKIMLNSAPSPIKRSVIDKKMNTMIFILLAILVVCCTVFAIYFDYSAIPYLQTYSWYYYINHDSLDQFCLHYTFLTYIILFSTIIPISLNVTVEIMKLFLAYFINHDITLYHEPTDTPAVVKTSSVIEDLGQINYVFTDKTGTLTNNMMELKQISVNGIIYGTTGDFVKEALSETDSQQNEYLHEFFTFLALCNTIISQHINNSYNFKSSSPDEIALAEGIHKCSYTISDRSPKELTVIIRGRKTFFQILDVLEFTSDRKCMSVIVRHDNKLHLICKGADSVILPRIGTKIVNHAFETVFNDLSTFAQSGFRTLCLAARELDDVDYQNWKVLYAEASLKPTNREVEVAQCCDLVEKDLRLLGATAIEDRLQEGIPDCVECLREAGICFFMLTGDRVETAINIGHSTSIISSSMDVRIISASSLEVCKEQVRKLITEYKIETIGNNGGNNQDKVKLVKRDRPTKYKDLCVVIDGNTLPYVIASVCKDMTIDLLIHCPSVIFCRLSPAQKREVVKLFRDYVNGCVTLAIGDGANDCPMIQAAHVGVGITGREGMQAANSSDFAIAQFCYIKRLILFHGHNNFRRISSAICYSFYKNSVVNTILILYSFFTHFSAKIAFEEISYSMFNAVFAWFLPFCFGLFSQVAPSDVLLKIPKLFKSIENAKTFSLWTFMTWMLSGILHGTAIFILVYFSYCKAVVSFNPIPSSMDHFCHILFWCVMIVITSKACIEIYHWVLPSFICLLVGIISWIIYFSISSTIFWFRFFHRGGMDVDRLSYSTVIFWLSITAIPLVALLPDMITHTIKNTWLKSTDVLVNEIVHQRGIDMSNNDGIEQVNEILAQKKDLVSQRKQKYLGFAYSFSEDRVFRNFPKFFQTSNIAKNELNTK